MSIRIITISRLFGAGGGSLAAALGERLGWQVMDRRLIVEVSRQLEHPEEDIAEFEERGLSAWERAMAFASNAFPEMPIPPLQTYMTARVPEAAESILTQMAEREPLVVVGHGTQCMFGGRPDALHLRLIAPREQRTETVMQRLGIGRADAERHLKKVDADRHEFLRQVHCIESSDAGLYDLVINTREISTDEAADFIERLVQTRER